MFVIFFLYKVKNLNSHRGEKLENSKNIPKEKLAKVSIITTPIYCDCFGVFALKMCMGRVFFLWLHLECMKVCNEKKQVQEVRALLTSYC